MSRTVKDGFVLLLAESFFFSQFLKLKKNGDKHFKTSKTSRVKQQFVKEKCPRPGKSFL